MTARPAHLPDFDSPPLEEVILGVQFAALKNYTSVVAHDVWALFKEEYPDVEEHPALDPSFEIFGGTSGFQTNLQFRFGNPIRGRLWFVSPEKNHLIQFQEDRLLLNWRREKGSKYPHFESIASIFQSHLQALQNFTIKQLESTLDIKQVEVTYVNLIPVANYSLISEWFEFIKLSGIDLEGLNLTFNEVISGVDGKPYARFVHEVQAAITRDGKEKGFRFNLTFRGKPSGNQISDAMSFASAGREKIVTRFKALTTEYAHKQWELKV